MSELEMLSPRNSAIALIDFQPAMYRACNHTIVW